MLLLLIYSLILFIYTNHIPNVFKIQVKDINFKRKCELNNINITI